MTLLAVRNQLLSILCERDTITPKEFPLVELDRPDLEPQRDALVRAVLADLCTAGVLRALDGAPGTTTEISGQTFHIPAKPTSTWVLTQPLDIASQQITLSLPTAVEVTGEINAFSDAFEEDWPVQDSLSLDEASILMLLAIITNLRQDDDSGPTPSGEPQN